MIEPWSQTGPADQGTAWSAIWSGGMTSNDVGTASQPPVAGSPTAVFATVDHDRDERATSPGSRVRPAGAASVRTCRDRTGAPSLRLSEMPPNPLRWHAERPVFVSVRSAAPLPAGASAGASAATSWAEVQTPTVVGGALGVGVVGTGVVGIGVVGTGVVAVGVEVDGAGVGFVVVGLEAAEVGGRELVVAGAPTLTPPRNEHPARATPVTASTARTSGRDTGARTHPV